MKDDKVILVRITNGRKSKIGISPRGKIGFIAREYVDPNGNFLLLNDVWSALIVHETASYFLFIPLRKIRNGQPPQTEVRTAPK